MAGEFEALLPNVREADALPLAWGLKFTVNVALCPAARVVGSVKPAIVNSELFDDTEEIVTLEPVAVSVPVSPFVLPTVTDPKLKLAGLMPSWPLLVPVPAIEIGRLGLGALEVMVKVPVREPADFGANVTVNVRLWPAVSWVGVDKPETVNDEPVTVA